MSTVTVHGYDANGISYAVVLDDADKDAMTGVISQGGTNEFISTIEAASGQTERLHPTGASYEIGLDTIEGVLAYLVNRTQVTTLTGDLPDDLDDASDAVAADAVH